jgi:hypothetical protein
MEAGTGPGAGPLAAVPAGGGVTGNGRELGGSFTLGSWRVRRAGYGAMQLAGDGVFGPPRDRDEALRVLRAAAAAGVNHIDTAQFYGAGTVNELIREALYPYPDGLAIVSKVGARRDADGAVLRPWEARELRQGIEDNLRALGTGRLAAVNLRLMDPAETPGSRFDAQLAVLAQAREEGLTGGVGTGCSPIPSSPRWGYGWARRRCRSRSPGCWTWPRMCCSFREPGRGPISPTTSPAPASSLTMSPGRSWPGTFPQAENQTPV